MEWLNQYDSFTQPLLLLGLSLTRISVAFLILPLFSSELMPALVRNSIFVAMALITLVLVPQMQVQSIAGGFWVVLFAKELMLGVFVGVFFGIYLWAFEAAGVLIDTQVGSSIGMVFDPLSGHEVTLTGEFMSLWANYLFMAAGGLLLLTIALLQSFTLYPILSVAPKLELGSLQLVAGEFSSFLSWTLLIASPVLLVLFVIDMVMGLINRYAQQLNVLFLSMSIKSLAALLVLILMMPVLIDSFMHEISVHSENMVRKLEAIEHTTQGEN